MLRNLVYAHEEKASEVRINCEAKEIGGSSLVGECCQGKLLIHVH